MDLSWDLEAHWPKIGYAFSLALLFSPHLPLCFITLYDWKTCHNFTL